MTSTIQNSQGVGAGYIDVFYDLAKMMGIGARAKSPKEVWATEMRPRIVQSLAREPATADVERGTLANPSTFGKPTFGLSADDAVPSSEPAIAQGEQLRLRIAAIIDPDASLPQWRQFNRDMWQGRHDAALAKADRVIAALAGEAA